MAQRLYMVRSPKHYMLILRLPRGPAVGVHAPPCVHDFSPLDAAAFGFHAIVPPGTRRRFRFVPGASTPWTVTREGADDFMLRGEIHTQPFCRAFLDAVGLELALGEVASVVFE